MDGVGGLAGWRWIFILEGIATVLIGLLATFVLPADIASAKFLTEEERAFALNRYHADDINHSPSLLANAAPTDAEKGEVTTHVDDVTHRPTSTVYEEKFERGEVIRGLLDIQTWLTGFAYFGLIVGLYSFSLFLPTIVAGLGYSGAEAQVRTVPPYVPATVLTVIVAVLSDRLKWRGPFILICLPLAIVGYILAIVAKTNGVRYIAVFFMAAGIYPSGPCILSILPNNTAGHYKKATTTALQLAIANCGCVTLPIFCLRWHHDSFSFPVDSWRHGHTLRIRSQSELNFWSVTSSHNTEKFQIHSWSYNQPGIHVSCLDSCCC
jgi:hypothetical protein